MRFSMTRLALCASIGCLAPAVSQAALIFGDDFESGNLNNWTSTAGTPSPFVISNARNAIPSVGGTFSAAQDTSADRMHHNLLANNGGAEVSGASYFESWIYDPAIGGSSSTRMFNEIRGYTGSGLPNGGIAADGALSQLFAIGKYNTVDAVANGGGQTFNANKYQARVVSQIAGGPGVGWFNLDLPGSPNRSVGWHQFVIERLADDTTINFYVDGILSGTFVGATAASWDTVVIGGGLGTTATDSNVDGIVVASGAFVVPEPAALAPLGLAALALGRRSRR